MKLLLYEPTFLFSISQSDLNIQKHTSRQYMPRKMQPINYRDCNRGASGWLALRPDPLCSLGTAHFVLLQNTRMLLTSQGLNDHPGTTLHVLIAFFHFWELDPEPALVPALGKAQGNLCKNKLEGAPALQVGACVVIWVKISQTKPAPLQ